MAYLPDISPVRTTPEAQAALIEVGDSIIKGKKWYLSKTVWANAIAVAAILVQYRFGFFIDPGTQAIILAGVNQWLRKISTEPIVW